MGLVIRVANMSDDIAYEGAYKFFNDWRRWIAKWGLGIDLDEMEGFNGTTSWDGIDNPLVKLLNHSDCSSHIEWEFAEEIGKHLTAIADVAEHFVNKPTQHIADCRQFVEACDVATDLQTPLMFR